MCNACAAAVPDLELYPKRIDQVLVLGLAGLQ
eukprot:COSAG02_NODE_20411_length_833_cov_0.851499_1_plen_31_part_10